MHHCHLARGAATIPVARINRSGSVEDFIKKAEKISADAHLSASEEPPH